MPSRRPLVLWLVALGLLLLFVPLYFLGSTIQADTLRLESELSQAQLGLASEPTPNPTTLALQSQITQTQQQISQLSAIQTNLTANQTNWPEVLAAIRDYDTNQISLTGLTQADNRLTITGQAHDDSLVIAYAQRLEASGQFNRVVVQSISLLPTPPATATPTTTPTTAVADATPTSDGSNDTGGSGGTTPQPSITPTPNYRDAYEIDDAAPQPIFIGQAQSRNFYPSGDIDNVYFLAKGGRYYRITTAALAPGVDTFLNVTIGDIILSNDDGNAGSLASEVSFQVPGGDINIAVQVTNRGQDGPQMSYQLLVQEVVPTVIPTLPPGPTATNTPLPTGTPTPTGTPDWRDPYEPDDLTPANLVINETQTHNFYPFGDVDRVSFLTKAGRFYQAATSNLALGVDTRLVASLSGQQWSNDDYALPGTGNFASAVCFPAAINGTAVLTVTNQMQQYNPSNTYNLSVLEVPALYLSTTQLTFGPVAAGGPNPPTQTVQLTGDPTLAWTAVTGSSWLQVQPTSGTAPTWINATATITGLAPGTYQDTITFSWASLCRQTITATLHITAAPITQTTSPLTAPHRVLAKSVMQAETAVSFVILVELKTDN